MIGADLEELLAGPLAQPVGKALVQVGPGRLRQAGVRHFPDQHVLEAISGLARDRRAELRDEKFPEEQRLEHGLKLIELDRQFLDRPAPEGAADHRSPLQHRFLVRGEPVDAGGDERLQRVGDPLGKLGQRPPLAFREHAHRLFDEERVPFRLLEERLASAAREHSGA